MAGAGLRRRWPAGEGWGAGIIGSRGGAWGFLSAWSLVPPVGAGRMRGSRRGTRRGQTDARCGRFQFHFIFNRSRDVFLTDVGLSLALDPYMLLDGMFVYIILSKNLCQPSTTKNLYILMRNFTMVEKIKDHPSVHTCKNVTLFFFYQKSERIKQTR